jgi:hypothetical protein
MAIENEEIQAVDHPLAKRNLSRADLVWHSLTASRANDDLNVWEHNRTAEKVAIVETNGQYRVEARQGNVVIKLESWDAKDLAQAYALGVRQGAISGEVIGDG